MTANLGPNGCCNSKNVCMCVCITTYDGVSVADSGASGIAIHCIWAFRINPMLYTGHCDIRASMTTYCDVRLPIDRRTDRHTDRAEQPEQSGTNA